MSPKPTMIIQTIEGVGIDVPELLDLKDYVTSQEGCHTAECTWAKLPEIFISTRIRCGAVSYTRECPRGTHACYVSCDSEMQLWTQAFVEASGYACRIFDATLRRCESCLISGLDEGTCHSYDNTKVYMCTLIVGIIGVFLYFCLKSRRAQRV